MVYILTASHLAIHTWPENGYLHSDILTSAKETDFNVVLETLKQEFEGSEIHAEILEY